MRFARFSGKPIAPVGPLTIHAFSHDSVTLSWSPPDPSDVGSISSYRIEKREVAKGPFWEVVGTADASDTSYIVRGLRSGTDYYFRVIAENGAGASAPLTLDKSFIPKMPYGEFRLCFASCFACLACIDVACLSGDYQRIIH